MSFNSEKLKIMIRKNVMRIRPSIRLKATDGLTGCKYVRTVDQALSYHGVLAVGAGATVLELSAAVVVPAAPEVALVLVTAAGVVAQPAAMNNAFVSNNGAATNSRMLKINAKMIDPVAAAVFPFFNHIKQKLNQLHYKTIYLQQLEHFNTHNYQFHR